MVVKPIIQVRNIVKEYESDAGKVRILKGITTQFKRGEVVSIMGPSGSGKSTLLGILGTLDRPTHGQLIIDNQDVTTLSEAQLACYRANKIGFVFQSYNLISTMNALENVMLPMMSGKGMSRRKMSLRAKELLQLVGMGDRLRHLPSQLSGGQQQRVAIARALANKPLAVIADEPTGNLDSQNGNLILDLIFALREKLGMTFVIATHDSHVAQMSDRVLYMADGRILQEVVKGGVSV